MSNTEQHSAGDDAWADARARYEQSAEPVAVIAAGLGLTAQALVREATLRSWQLRGGARTRKPSTRSALMRLRDTLQARISQFEQHLAELGKEANAIATEKDARAMNLLVRTLEKVLDLERKHNASRTRQRKAERAFDDVAREELIRRIEALPATADGEANC